MKPNQKISRVSNKLLGIIRPYRSFLLACVSLNIILVLGNLYRTRCVEMLIDNIGKDEDMIWKLVVQIVIVVIISMFVIYFIQFSSAKFGLGVSNTIKLNLFRKLSRSSLLEIQELRSGEIISKMNNEMDVVQKFLKEDIVNLMFQPLMFVLSAAYMIYLNHILFILCYVFLPLIVIIINQLNKKSVKYAENYYTSLGEANGLIKEVIDNVTTVKVNNLSSDMMNKCRKSFNGVVDNVLKSEKLDSCQLPLYFLLNELPKIICLLFGGFSVINKNMTLGEWIAFRQLIVLMEDPMNQISEAFKNIRRFKVSLKRIDEICDISDDTVYLEEKSDKTELKKTGGHIEFKNVDFSFGDKEVIRNLSMEIKEGEKVAIVGSSGEGKTTLLNLLTKTYEINGGDVLINGKSYKSMSDEDVHSYITYVLQDSFLYPLSIADNIKIANIECSEEEIKECVRWAQCAEFVKEQKDGLDTIISESGKNYSGGQRQRLSIARAFARKTPILLLDEPTSSLDELTEKLVMKGLFSVHKSKTIVVVTHKFSFMDMMDRIIVLEDGRVAEMGTHNYLLKKNGVYKKLYTENCIE